MKILKAILMNPLVLATLVTVVASTVLVAYADHKLRPAVQASTSALRDADGMRRNLIEPSASAQADGAISKDEGTRPIIILGIKIPAASFIESML